MLTMDRSKAVEFFYPHSITSVTFITTQPQEELADIYLAIRPFSITVWIVLLLSLFVCFLFDKLYNHVYSHHHHITNVFWYSIYSMFRQPYIITINDNIRTSSNIWFVIWSFATMILTTVYGGYLVSLTTIPFMIKTIDTVEELAFAVESNKITFTGHKHSTHPQLLLDTENELYNKLGRSMKYVETLNDALSMVSRASAIKDSYALIANAESLRIGQLIYGEKTIYLPPLNQLSTFFIDILIIPVRTNFKYKDKFSTM